MRKEVRLFPPARMRKADKPLLLVLAYAECDLGSPPVGGALTRRCLPGHEFAGFKRCHLEFLAELPKSKFNDAAEIFALTSGIGSPPSGDLPDVG